MALGHQHARRFGIGRRFLRQTTRARPRVLVPSSAVTLDVPPRLATTRTSTRQSPMPPTSEALSPDNPLCRITSTCPLPITGASPSASVVSSAAAGGQVKGLGRCARFSAIQTARLRSEIGCFCARGNTLGQPIPIDAAESYDSGSVCERMVARGFRRGIPASGPFPRKFARRSRRGWSRTKRSPVPQPRRAPARRPRHLDYRRRRPRGVGRFEVTVECCCDI